MPSDSGPSLDFEWELSLFRGLRAIGRRIFARRGPNLSVDAVSLAPRAARLTVLAQLFAGRPMRVLPAPGAAGLLGSAILLPATIDGLGGVEAHEAVYVVRTVLAAELARRGATRALPGTRALRAAHEADSVLAAFEALAHDLPNLAALTRPLAEALLAARRADGLSADERLVEAARRRALARLAGVPAPPLDGAVGRGHAASALLWGELLADSELSREERAIAAEEARAPTGVTTEIAAPDATTVRFVELDKKKIEDSTLTHTFEKVETADAFSGGGRDLDGTDELEDHGEALSEVPLASVTRSDEDVHAILRADTGSLGAIPDVASAQPGERGIPYDEWDTAKRSYRRAHCTVYPTRCPAGDPAFARPRLLEHASIIDETERALEVARFRLAERRRQRDGERVDVDAVVRHQADLRSGHASDGRLYVRRARELPSLATTVLMDVSLSSDAWVDDRRVLDVEQDAVLVLGEVMDRLGDPLEILAFCSHTRNRCRVFDVRRAGEPWSVGKARIAALRPQGYTRIGPALRHATAQLRGRDAQRRLLLLLSDGNPTDYDRYEGRHGVDDVRQAVREAKAGGVHIHGLTLDPRGRHAFPAMFGPGHHHLLADVSALPRALSQVYARLRMS